MQSIAVSRRGRAIGEESKILRTSQCRLCHELQGLTGVHAFDKCDLFGPRNDSIGDPVQEIFALLAIHSGPTGEGALSGGGSAINICRFAVGNLCDALQIDGRQRLEGRAVQCGQRLAGDMIENTVRLEACELFVRFQKICIEIRHSSRSLFPRFLPDVAVPIYLTC